MKKWFTVSFPLVIFSFVALLSWYREWGYSLSASVAEQHQTVSLGSAIDLTGTFSPQKNNQLFLHFFNSHCRYSTFNIPHFKSPVTEYADKISFIWVVKTKDKACIEGGIWEKYEKKNERQMPYMDGVELMRYIKQSYPGLHAILLSSVGDERNKKYESLFKSVLIKPIKQEMLCKLMINELRGKSKLVTTFTAPQKQKLSVDFVKEHPLKILVAEDNLINQNLTLKILSKLGFKAALAKNGRRAIERACRQHYHVILVNVKMPETDGLETNGIIRCDMNIQPIVIAMTKNIMEEDKEECIKAGPDNFITKTVGLKEVMTIPVKCSTIAKQYTILNKIFLMA